MVELGCYRGISTSIFAQRFNHVSTIDRWGSGKVRSDPARSWEDIEIEARARLSAYNNVEIIKSDTSKAAERFADGSLDFIYIDANHNYSAIKLLLKGVAEQRATPDRARRRSHNGRIKYAIHMLAEKSKTRRKVLGLIDILISAGANISKPDPSEENRDTLLHQAARDNNLPLAELLIQHAADVNCRNKYKSTPLHLAATSEQGKKGIPMIDLLLSAGADMGVTDKYGETPLIAARKERKRVIGDFFETYARRRKRR